MAFSLRCSSLWGMVGSLREDKAAEEEEEEWETDRQCWVSVLVRMEEEEEEGGRTHAVWRIERQKNAKKRWRTMDRHARPR